MYEKKVKKKKTLKYNCVLNDQITYFILASKFPTGGNDVFTITSHFGRYSG